jgi:uncharacterized membrane protein
VSSTVGAAPERRDGRIVAIDALRGLVMVIMALDHTRDFLHLGSHGLDPTDPAASNPVLFATRWITHLCAPTFVLLSGLSAWLQRREGKNRGGKSRGELSGFLLTRGLWLILVDAVVVSFALNFNFDLVILTVIAAIGASMVLLAGLIWLPARAVLVIGVALIAGHNLFDGFDAKALGPLADPFRALVGPIDLAQLGPVKVLVAYAILPWTGVMALGYGLGPLFNLPARKRGRILTLLGLAMIVGFVAIRAVNLYGDPRPWAVQPTQARAVMAFLSVTKYPPSLDFVLATLGAVLMLTPWLERLGGKLAGVLATYGRVPLFYYVGHLYVLHLIALGAGLALGRPLASLMTNPSQIAGFGFSLTAVYAIWIVVVLAFYPLCAWYGDFRRRHRDWRWLSYF